VTETLEERRWAARPLRAALIRGFAFLAPIAGSLLFVHFASTVVAVPTGSFFLFISWWAVMSGGATVVLMAIDRVTRRLLPLAALFKLSLVFPDAAPSRFKAALRTNTVDTLEQRVAAARRMDDRTTPVEAAELLLGLVAELDSHDRLTRGHSERVRAYSQMIAKQLGLGSRELDLINWAALLHDVGKLSVPSEILTKPGRPTEAEWGVLRQHPVFGAELVESMHGWLGDWLSAVDEHHERWDGSGYPRGLAGDEISLAARIVAVADVFDVITSVRSYKSASVPAAARNEIARCAGTQFDPRVVRAFLNVSLGRLRLVMGPLSWLAHAPLLGRIPLSPAVGTVTASLGTAAAALATGIVGAPATPALAATAPVAAHAVSHRAAPLKRHAVPPTHRAVHPAPRLVHRVVASFVTPAPPVPTARVSPRPSSTSVAPPAKAPTGPDVVPSPPVTVAVPAERPQPEPPRFVGGGDQRVLEDAGPQAVVGWASVDARLDVSLSTDDQSLFAAQPALRPDGALTYATAADANGTTAVTVRSQPVTGGAPTVQRFSIVVVAVNDAPSFQAGPGEHVFENAGRQTRAGWATAISAGPANEATQRVGFRVSTDRPALFAVEPSISPDGILTYTPAVNAHGTAVVTVQAVDDGGTADGGVDASRSQTFSIVIEHLNHAPIATADTVPAVEDDAAGVTFDVLANDTDVDGDTLTLVSYDGSSLAGGTLSSNGSGSFTYIPDPSFVGADSFTYVVRDVDGATSSGSVTIAVTAVQHAPVAGSDSYGTAQNTPLTVSAPGLLANDGDPDGDAVSVITTPESTPANGSVVLAADGSFTYTPVGGYSGTDSFTYRVEDGTGRSAIGSVTVTVSSAPVLPSTFYFQSTGPSSDVWNMTSLLPPGAPLLADLDSDGRPGMTIKNSDGRESRTESDKSQTWIYAVPSPLVLNGPVSLDLWSSTRLFVSAKPGTLFAYLYDCTAAGASCTKIAENTAFAQPWNTSLIDWSHRVVTIGSVSRTIPAGHELRVKLMFRSEDLWLTMTAAYPTALVVSG
jgi:putative nucleotidyltransferase with HDIG domain